MLRPEPDFSNMPYVAGGGAALPLSNGLPVVKPPYGRITAIDMNKGDLRWQIANGPTPKDIAENPALKGVTLPPTGRTTRAVVLATKTLLFAAEGWGGAPVLRALRQGDGRGARRDQAAGRGRQRADELRDRGQAVRRGFGCRRARRGDRRAVAALTEPAH